MSLRPSNVHLLMLTALWAGGAVPATASSSALPLRIDLDVIARQACGFLENPGGTLSKCRIRPDLREESNLKSAGTGASAGALKFVSTETIVTSCGTWDAKLTLDPSLSLKDPKHGILEIRARLYLTHQATGRTVDYPLGLGLGLTGPWSLASPGDSGDASPWKSARPAVDEKGDEDECIPAWLLETDPELAQQLLDEGCPACPEKATAVPRDDSDR